MAYQCLSAANLLINTHHHSANASDKSEVSHQKCSIKSAPPNHWNVRSVPSSPQSQGHHLQYLHFVLHLRLVTRLTKECSGNVRCSINQLLLITTITEDSLQNAMVELQYSRIESGTGF